MDINWLDILNYLVTSRDLIVTFGRNSETVPVCELAKFLSKTCGQKSSTNCTDKAEETSFLAAHSACVTDKGKAQRRTLGEQWVSSR